MPIINRIAEFHPEMTAWRRDFHEHPELGFEETRTSAVIAEKLREFGCDEVVTGIAKTGIVGVIRGRVDNGRAIGLRADIDALPILEETGLPYASKIPGKMHACGHDGHTTMLLGAAKYLAETRNFDGTVYVIFQPAEENLAGGEVMVKEGLFTRFPMERVFGMHNWPGAPEGTFLWREGPVMAAVANLEVNITGKGAHGAMPHNGVDPIVVAAAIVQALQSIVARNVEPVEAGVITIGHINGGHTFNVIPENVGATATAEFARAYPATINEVESVHLAAKAARAVQGEARVLPMPKPTMGGEDFSFMLNAKAGAYVMLGGGRGPNEAQVHHPLYDFNDNILPVGASYWARLAEQLLPRG
jgi:hippurate hydrolase